MIVVTTPTGNIGHHVVRHLLDAGEALRVIARDPAKLPQAARDRVEVVEGSHDDADVVTRAFDGAEAVFWLCPPNRSATPEAGTVDFSRPAAEAIRRHGIARIVAVTTHGRDTAWQDRAGMATASIRMVDQLRETGAAVRGLALPAFMDNALQQVAAIKEGWMAGSIDPDKRLPHTATRDMGAAAARLLRDRSWTRQEDVPVLGPAQLRERGVNGAFVQAYVDMLRAKDAGMDNAAPRASAIIGPTTFRQWAEEKLKPAVLG